jgi:hypothetical protein
MANFEILLTGKADHENKDGVQMKEISDQYTAMVFKFNPLIAETKSEQI